MDFTVLSTTSYSMNVFCFQVQWIAIANICCKLLGTSTNLKDFSSKDFTHMLYVCTFLYCAWLYRYYNYG